MATVSFSFVKRCGPAQAWVQFAVKVGGVERGHVVTTADKLLKADATRDSLENVAGLLIQHFCREWRRTNPAGTLAQLRTALEAASWEV